MKVAGRRGDAVWAWGLDGGGDPRRLLLLDHGKAPVLEAVHGVLRSADRGLGALLGVLLPSVGGDLTALPSFGLVVRRPGGVAAFVRGDVVVRVFVPGELPRELTGVGLSTWAEAAFGEVSRVEVTAASSGGFGGSEVWPLVDGVVRAGFVVWGLAEEAASSAFASELPTVRASSLVLSAVKPAAAAKSGAAATLGSGVAPAAKPDAGKSSAAQPGAVRAGGLKPPAGLKPGGSQPVDSRPLGSNPVDSSPADSQPVAEPRKSLGMMTVPLRSGRGLRARLKTLGTGLLRLGEQVWLGRMARSVGRARLGGLARLGKLAWLGGAARLGEVARRGRLARWVRPVRLKRLLRVERLPRSGRLRRPRGRFGDR